MVDHLRPDLIIEQQFVTRTPVVLTSPLNNIIFGINRQMVWKADAGTYTGGQANPAYNFPGLASGATVEQPTATDTTLRPHVYIRNRFGDAEVSPTYDFVSSPPTFTLTPTEQAVFEVATGTTGEYSATSGKFIDANADFIEAEIAANDVIKIGGVDSFTVTALVSDDELDVTRIDKGPDTWTGDLSAKDGNGDRTLTDLAFDFEAVTSVGDLVTVKGWDILSQADGIDYSIETAGIRTVTGTTYNFLGSGVQGPITGPPYQVDVVWIKDPGDDWTPSFKVTGNVAATTFSAANLITSPAWPATGDSEENKIFEIFHYTEIDLDPATGPLWTDVTGSYTAEVAGSRTFSVTNPVINFTTLLTLPLSRYSVVVHGINDAGGTTNARPIFKITAILGINSLTVQNWDPDRPAPSATGAGVTWEIWDDGGTPVVSFLGSTISAENPADSDKRTLTSTYNTFISDGVAPGDIVYSDTGMALFFVTDVLLETQIKCVNIVPGSPAPSWNSTEFGFYISDVTEAQLLVTRIIDANTLGVRNVITADPPDRLWTDLHYTITVPDSMDDISYTIEKTLTGTALTGTVLSTFTARKNESLTSVIEITQENREATVGYAVPGNPLGLAAYLALLNTPYSVYGVQVASDTVAAWQAALNVSLSPRYYVLAPITQNETVLGYFRTSVLQESEPEQKRERILFQSHLFNRVTERTTDQAGDNAQYTKTASTTTITVNRDLSAYGVIIGDVFVGLTPAFSARIITLVSGVTTTMTVVNDNGLPIGGPTAITDWKIQSKDLSDEEYADMIGDYPGTIASRRFRNVYPDRCEITFTDSTDPSEISGFYGGGDVTQEVGGEYLAVLEAAKRSGVKPGQPISRFNGTGIHSLINPFGDPEGGNEDLNDRVLDGGNWLLSQQTDDGPVYAIRAVTTDVSEIFFLEDHVTVQVDNFARLLRNQIRPLLGPFNIDDAFFDIVSANVEAVRRKVLDDRDARSIEFLDIREDENQPDTFLLDFNFGPYVTGAKGRVTIYV